jgi:hypothetical protein
MCAVAGLLAWIPRRPAEPAFEPSVDLFRAEDSAGRPYTYPFLGGFNNPRPQLVDIDGDGDLDLFVQEYTGRMRFFERTGHGAGARYMWRSDSYQQLDVGEWSRFVDADGDGDLDLFAESPYSYIRYYRNDGDRQHAHFVLAADTLRDVDGHPIDNDRQNIPQIVDVDCNGRLDLLLGRVSGTVTRYEADGAGPAGPLRFRFRTDRFQDIQIIGQLPAAPSLHGANTMIVTDLDRDGDQDILWGDYFDPGLLWLVNTGSCAHPVIGRDSVRFPPNAPLRSSGYNAPAVADLDGDGDLDLLVGILGGAFNANRTAQDNLYFYEQTGPQIFTLRTTRFLDGIDVGGESQPAFVDLDGDSDLDLVIGNKIEPDDPHSGALYVFENRGTARVPVFRFTGRLDITGEYHYAPAFGDVDGDGLPDLVLGTWRDALLYYRNAGTKRLPKFVLADSALVRLTRGSYATPALADLDGDGDLDLLVGESSGTINFYRNDGSRTAPHYVLVSDTYEGIDVGRRSAPTLVDLDGDGLLDLVIGTEAGPPVAYRNRGTRRAPRFVADGGFTLPLAPLSSPTFADLDGDGDPDLFAGSSAGGVALYVNRRRR